MTTDPPSEPNHSRSHARGSDLPVDSDLAEEGDAAPPRTPLGTHVAAARPVHLHWRYVGVVALGGAVGTAIREALSLAVPDLNGVALIIFAINVVGACALGFLLESLSQRGPDVGRQRTLRLLLGTGVLGGFTTYSSLATGTGILFTADRPGAAVLYALATVLVGAGATFAGIVLATRSRRHRGRAEQRERPLQPPTDEASGGVDPK